MSGSLAPPPPRPAVRAHRAGPTALLLALACRVSAPVGPAPGTGETALAGRLFDRVLALPLAHGHPRRAAGIDGLAALLDTAGCRPVLRHRFAAHDPWRGTTTTGTNLLCRTYPGRTRRWLLATHFDPPPAAHEDPDPRNRRQPVPGANDGASGVVTILWILARAHPDDVGFDVVLFDGEELGTPRDGGYLAGSRALAADLDRVAPWLRAVAGGVVLDMVAGRHLAIRRDPASVAAAAPLVNHLFATAARLGVDAFVPQPGPNLGDDHLPLLAAGIPVVLLIDRDDPTWHTTADDRRAIEPAHAVAVARVVAEAARTAPYPMARRNASRSRIRR